MRTWTPGAVAVLASLTVGGCGEVERDLSSLRAVNAFEEGRWDLARAWSERAIAEGTEGLEIRRLAARAWSRGPFQISSKQAEAWRRVLDLVPDDPEALLALAQALDTLDDPAASEVLERAPDGVDVSRLRGRMELRRDPTAARATLERAVNEFPDDAQLAAELAQACALTGDRSAALRWASRALDLDPQDRGSRQLRGRLLAIEGRRDEAAREIEIHELLTIVAGDQGAASATPLERVRALRRLRDLTSLDTPEIRATEVDLLLQAGLPGEAAPLAADLIRDRTIRLPRRIGWANGVGDRATAVSLLEESLRLSSPALSRHDAVTLLAGLLRVDEPERAIALLEDALADDPQVGRQRCLLGTLQAERGLAKAAEENLERGVRLSPWRVECRLALAELWERGGRREDVAALLADAPEPERVEAFRSQHGY